MGRMGCGGSIASRLERTTLGSWRAREAAGDAAGGGEETAAPDPERACRVTVHILAAKGLRRKEGGPDAREPVFQLQVERVVRTWRWRRGKEGTATLATATATAASEEEPEAGVLAVNQSFSFQVKEPQRAWVSVQVAERRRGMLGMRDALLGRVARTTVRELLAGRDGTAGAGATGAGARWYPLLGEDGETAMPGKLLMQIVATVAEAEERVSAFVGSWNVGNARPPADLSPWIPRGLEHDIVAIGSQECEYQPRAPFSDCGTDWVETLRKHLGQRYTLLQAVSRSQMRLAVFVRDGAQRAVSEVETASEATGVGHVVANKGGVCIAFKFWDTGLCFVNCHFAAHAGQCEARNGNFREIAGQIRVGIPGVDILNQFHHVFWLGDLNYRLDVGGEGNGSKQQQQEQWRSVVEQIRGGKFAGLLQRDELGREKAASRVLHGFREGEITFAPTFKVKRDLVEGYEEKRVPAWCDRILWKDLPGCAAELDSYTSAPGMLTSDHKPVAATFRFTARAMPCASPSAGSPEAEQDNRWNIRFTALRARDLRPADINGFSDPYVSFVGPVLLQEVHSKVKPRTLTPVWEPALDLPPLVLSVMTLERLRMDFLPVRVLDRDYTSADDHMAYGVIPLAGLVDAFDRGVQGQEQEAAATFQVELTFKGLPAGVLEGAFQLSFQPSITRKKSRVRSVLMDRTLSLRDSVFKQMLSRRHVHGI